MILWTIKLIKTARRAIAGRKYPHQLAWAVAFGLLLGIVPHGNLLALALLILVLSLKLNHAMAGLTAVAASFGASHLDPYSHLVGDRVLSDPRMAEIATRAWQLPMVPWTDLNNTIVMGSFLIGVAALIPVFVITYPVFRVFAPTTDPEPSETAERSGKDEAASHEIVLVDSSHAQVAPPHQAPAPVPSVAVGESLEGSESSSTFDERLENALRDADSASTPNEPKQDVAVETRIDVIRMKDYRDTGESTDEQSAANAADEPADQQQPMDEALNYLLRQLRDSQQRKVA